MFAVLKKKFELRKDIGAIRKKLKNHKALPLDCQDEYVLRALIREHNHLVNRIRA